MDPRDLIVPAAPARLRLPTIFWIFFKSGLAFGGGLSILALLQDELVLRRRVVTREEFMTIYSLARIVPSGTMTAIAVAFGRRFGGFPGTVAALGGLTLPAFVTTVALAAGYTALRDTRLVELLPVTILPAALALVAAAAVNLARATATRLPDMAIAAAALAAAAALHASPAVVLLLGGAAGAAFLRPRDGDRP